MTADSSAGERSLRRNSWTPSRLSESRNSEVPARIRCRALRGIECRSVVEVANIVERIPAYAAIGSLSVGSLRPAANAMTGAVAAQVVAWFVARWPLEVTFQEARALLGLETTRHWCRQSVLRVTPILLGLFTAANLLPQQALLIPLYRAYREIPLPLGELPSREQIESDLESSNKYVAARARLLRDQLERAFTEPYDRFPTSPELAQAGVEVALDEIFRVFVYTEYGGAPLLGLNGVSIICHGGSPPRAICNAIRVAIQSVETRLVGHIESAVAANDGNTARQGAGSGAHAEES